MTRTRSALILGLALPVLATDHNNLDKGRPLRFEDAESLAWRERAFEGGLGFLGRAGRANTQEGDFAYLYGFAPNWHASLEWSPTRDPLDGGFKGGEVSLAAFHTFRREIGDLPALALSGSLVLPARGGERGIGGRLRGILSKSLGYHRLHLNLDLDAAPDPAANERKVRPGAVLGYSHPLGFPQSFTATFLAEASLRASPLKDAGSIFSLGVGFRQQVSLRGVLDLGLSGDLPAPDAIAKERLRVVAGYSLSF